MQVIGDFNTSVRKAFSEIDPSWEKLDGLVICGTHAPTDVEEQIEMLKVARESDTPTLGICFGFQLMAVEYARNVLGIKNATSQEFGVGTPVVYKLPGFRTGIFPVGDRYESHWHQYAIDPNILFPDWKVIMTGDITEVGILKSHPFYVGVQFHPEYESGKDKPHPLLKEFLEKCK